MRDSRLERFVPLTGVIFVVFVLVGSSLAGTNEYLASSDQIISSFSESVNQSYAGAYLGMLGAFFLMWFAGSVYSTLRQHEGGTGRLSIISFGGGLSAAVSIVFAFAVLSMITDRAISEVGISAEEAAALYDIWSATMGVVMPIGLAAFVGAAAVVSLRTAVFPTWFAWISVLVALGCLSPVDYIAQTAAIVWVVVVSIWLTVRSMSRSGPSEVPDANIATA